MRHQRVIVLFLIVASALTGGCTAVRPPFDYASEPDPRKQEYVLGASDVLKITVWRNAELSAEAIVRPDGTISLPLIGDLRAAGRTPGQLRSEIVRRLSTFIKEESAAVTVAVTTTNSYRFVLSGNFEKPGAYSANHFVTVSEAIAVGGGPNRYASPENTVIIRIDATRGMRRIPIDYPGILSGARSQEDLPLVSGDTIFIP